MSEFEPGIYRVATYAWIKKMDRYLIAKRSLEERFMPGYWSLVGGKLETDGGYNVLEKNLEKEILEESGVEVENIKLVGNYCDVSRSIIYIVYLCDRKKGEAKPLEDMDDIKWLTIEELKTFTENNLFTTYLPFINK